MMSVKMPLSPKEKSIMLGEKGATLQKVMESVVRYGDLFQAEKLVDLDGPGHLVTSFGASILQPVFDRMDELIAAGLQSKLPFTVDPRPIDYKNVSCSLLQKLVFRIMYGRQSSYEEQLSKTGLRSEKDFTCTCYLPEVGNTPKEGQFLAWSESSAVVFANSVLGARTNRNSAGIDLLCNILGKAPLFGLLTDEGRRANWLVEVKTSKLPNPQVLGSAIGIKIVEDVPFISGLEKFFCESEHNLHDYLKDMGAASASNGAVGLYHVENLTPEAKKLGKDLLVSDHKNYVIDDQELQKILESYPVLWKKKGALPYKCFIGCPHLSLTQLQWWTKEIERILTKSNRKKLRFNTILCAAPGVMEKFSQSNPLRQKLEKAGVSFTSICPLMYMNNPLCAKKPVITNSNKLRTYSTARFYQDEDILAMI